MGLVASSNFSLISLAEYATSLSFEKPREYLPVTGHLIGRVVGVALLSIAAACEIVTHTILMIPAILYAIGKSIYQKKMDFTLPWQHLQRVQNAVYPLFFGSAFALIHPYAGLYTTEQTDKIAALGMLGSNRYNSTETPCSPVHSLSIIERIAKRIQTVDKDGKTIEIFPETHLNAIRCALEYEKGFQQLQAQEFLYKLTNLNLYVMGAIHGNLESSCMNEVTREGLKRLSGVLIPFLALIDLITALALQTFFLSTGICHWVSGKGPTYTEVTANPLMHVEFLIQTTLKTLGILIGNCVWFIHPMWGFQASLLPGTTFFNIQLNSSIGKLESFLKNGKEGAIETVPILLGNGTTSVLSIPSHSMHKTYLTIKKVDGTFELYWTNRPTVSVRKGLSLSETMDQVRAMVKERFPFMNLEKMMNYPIKSQTPKFPETENFEIQGQGSNTNCVVSNLFGMLETLDHTEGLDESVKKVRYQAMRDALIKEYGFYKYDFYAFSSDGINGFFNPSDDPI